MSSPRIALSIVIGMSLFPCHLIAGLAVDETVTQVLDNWQQRQSRYATARYVIESKTFFGKGSLSGSPGTPAGVQPAQDIEVPTRWEITIDLVGTLIRVEAHDSIWVAPLASFHPQVSMTVYDGSEIRGYRPKSENALLRTHDPEITVHRPTQNQNPLSMISFVPLRQFHGLTEVNPLPEPLRHEINRSRFQLRDLYASNDSTKAVLRRNRFESTFEEFTVDFTDDSRVREYRLYDNGLLRSEVIVDEFAAGGLPARWTERVFAGGDKLMLSRKSRLTESALNVELPDNAFQLPTYKTGMIVATDDGRQIVAEDGKTLVPLVVPVARESSVEPVITPRRVWPVVIAAALSLLLVVCFGWLRWNRDQKCRS